MTGAAATEDEYLGIAFGMGAVDVVGHSANTIRYGPTKKPTMNAAMAMRAIISPPTVLARAPAHAGRMDD